MGTLSRAGALSRGMNKAGIFSMVAATLSSVGSAIHGVLGNDIPMATSPFCPQVNTKKTHVVTESTGWCKANRNMLKRSKAKRAASKAKRGF